MNILDLKFTSQSLHAVGQSSTHIIYRHVSSKYTALNMIVVIEYTSVVSLQVISEIKTQQCVNINLRRLFNVVSDILQYISIFNGILQGKVLALWVI